MNRLLVVCCLVPTLVFAQSLAEAENLYGDGDFSAAQKMADVLLKRSSNAADTSRLHVLRGLVQVALGKNDKARAAFVLALQADAAAQLNAQRDPPAALALFEQSRESVPPGNVTVLSTLAEATLRIDGVDFGPLPLTTKLTVGRHVLVATGADGRVSRAELVVTSGASQSAQLDAPTVVEEPKQVAAAAPPPPLVPAEPQVDTSSRSATLLEQPDRSTRMTWWGLIPIVAAAGAGWLTPLMLVNESLARIGVPTALATVAVLGLGVGLLVQSAVRADAWNGKSPTMKWWGLIPLGVGVAATIATLATLPWLGGGNTAPPLVFASIAIVGLGVGGGMLIGHALGLPAKSPQVSIFPLPQGGGAVSLSGRF